jgi:catalase
MFTGNNFPVFAGKDPETFYGFLETLLPDASGNTDPGRVARYVQAHPSVQANAAWRQSARTAASYANTEFFGLHTFHYVGRQDAVTRFRWHLVPDLGVAYLEPADANALPAAFLADTLTRQLDAGKVSFTLEAIIGEAGDTDIDPSQQWPPDRARVTLGEVIVTGAGGDDCRGINFDPNLLSNGFKPSEDPVLRLRSAAYAISFSKRLNGK